MVKLFTFHLSFPHGLWKKTWCYAIANVVVWWSKSHMEVIDGRQPSLFDPHALYNVCTQAIRFILVYVLQVVLSHMYHTSIIPCWRKIGIKNSTHLRAHKYTCSLNTAKAQTHSHTPTHQHTHWSLKKHTARNSTHRSISSEGKKR